MAIMDLYTSTESAGADRAFAERSSDLCRYDSEASIQVNALLHEAGATDAMISVMSERDAQELIMASDEDRPHILEKLAERCSSQEDTNTSKAVRKFIGDTALKAS